MIEEGYESALKKVLKILNKYDPSGTSIFFMDTEYDEEYDIEAKEILKLLSSHQTAESITSMVNEVFYQYFDEPYNFNSDVGELLLALKSDYSLPQH